MPGEEQFNVNLPIYLQIMEQIRRRIVTGEWRAGERVPSVRELAAVFGVNPNTMQRALSELEREELLYSERTAGRFITADTARIDALRARMAKDTCTRFLHEMGQLGYARNEVLSMLAEPPGDGSERQEMHAASD